MRMFIVRSSCGLPHPRGVLRLGWGFARLIALAARTAVALCAACSPPSTTDAPPPNTAAPTASTRAPSATASVEAPVVFGPWWERARVSNDPVDVAELGSRE